MAHSTVEQLRGDIDSGRTQDKVSGPDPAAAPLGADEEAAGTPVSPQAAALARAYEVRAPADDREDGGTLFYLAVLTAIGAALIGAAFFLTR